MISLKNKSKGFTIVELLIVIVVIGILATLVIVTFTGIQQKARNSQRQTDINALDSHLEAFYAENGAYPSAKQVGTPAWVAKYMKGLDPAALESPKGAALNDTTNADHYTYSATQDDGTACADGDTTATADTPVVDSSCTKFTLSAPLEGDSTPYTKSSNT
jgi:type II secretion system protein G